MSERGNYSSARGDGDGELPRRETLDGRRYLREFGPGETQNVGQFGGSLRPGQNSPCSYQIILQEDEETWINLEKGFSHYRPARQSTRMPSLGHIHYSQIVEVQISYREMGDQPGFDFLQLASELVVVLPLSCIVSLSALSPPGI